MRALSIVFATLAASAALALAACPRSDPYDPIRPEPVDTDPTPHPSGPAGDELPPFTEAEMKALWDSSPLGAYDRGDRSEGVLDLMDPAVCRRATIESVLAHAHPPQRVTLFENDQAAPDRVHGSPDPLRVGPAADSWRRATAATMAMLVANGDAVVAGRHVCLGVARFESPNALSQPLGYLLFDPQLVFDVNQNADRSLYSFDAIRTHELAHQLQYWHGDETLRDQRAGAPYARRSELQADCVAGALIAGQALPTIGRELWDFSKHGIRAAVRAVGDMLLEDGGHHGTPTERDRAAAKGVAVGQAALLVDVGPYPQLTSKALLDACRAYIDANDQTYGQPWPDSVPEP